VNALTRSRIWRWGFPSDVGPYNRYSVNYRGSYQTVLMKDSNPSKKVFNGIELQAKYHPKYLGQKLYFYFLSNYSTVQKNWEPGLWGIVPIFNEDPYIKQYSNELEAYYAFNSKLVFSSYLGIERTLGNYETETDEISLRPLNQFGEGYGLGLDYTIAKNTALFIRHRWFSFKDKSFERDQFKGTETILELKITF